MKWIVPALALGVIGFGVTTSTPSEPANEVTIIISGGVRGHLSPCGCTKPMSGGLKRMATVVRDLKSHGNVLWIDSGDIIDTPGRQSQLKAETYGELMGTLGVDAVAYTGHDQRQGVGLLMAASPLSKRKWVTPNPDPTTPTIAESTVHGLTISATNDQMLQLEAERESNILLVDGSKTTSMNLQKPHDLVVFSSEGIPTIDGNRVSAGSNLRGVVAVTFRNGKFISAKVISLDPIIKDDPKADRIYQNYLNRVVQEKLIEGVGKESNDDYAGSVNCKSCHGKIYRQYESTKHAHAYNSLIKEGHQADPDCVSCHVTGLNSTRGFMYEKTKALAQVGCESCHGAGREHARNPRSVHLPKVTEKQCITCHTPSNSATFVFQSYWKKIKH